MTDDNDRIFDCMARMKGDNQPFALATVVRTHDLTSAKPGAKAVIRSDASIEGWIGGGCVRGAVLKAAARALADGRPRLIRVGPQGETVEADGLDQFSSQCPSGGTSEIFVEPVLPRPALLILGASPTARALAEVGLAAGFAVTVSAPKADLTAFSDGCDRIAGYDVSDYARGAESFVVVATQGRGDRRALEAAIGIGSPYVAFVGSRKKSAKLKADLAAAGAAPDRAVAVRGPAGLDIGAATPGEIALAVLADVVRERRQGIHKSDGDLHDGSKTASGMGMAPDRH
jgi:xanthine dehydrogenase accessory factor